MTKSLTLEQVAQYESEGYLFPIDVMPEQEALSYGHRLTEAEARYPEAINSYRRNNAHLTFLFLDEIVRHPRILDAVEDVIGPNILVWGTVLFIKEPRDPGFVSWHQDYTYMGLEPHDGVTAWLALSPSTETRGCVQVLPGSHKHGIHPHRDSFDDHNILSRGQTIDDLDARPAVSMVLRPGQMSLHHPRTIHGSQPNRRHSRRIGIAIQTYLPPHVRFSGAQGHATLVRGRDSNGNFRLLARPRKDMSPKSVALWKEVNGVREDVLFGGASQDRRGNC